MEEGFPVVEFLGVFLSEGEERSLLEGSAAAAEVEIGGGGEGLAWSLEGVAAAPVDEAVVVADFPVEVVGEGDAVGCRRRKGHGR